MRYRTLVFAGSLVLVTSCGSSAKHSIGSSATTGGTVAPTTATADIAVVQAYIDAFNRGDAASAAATFAASGELRTPLGGCSPCVGRVTIEQKFASAIASGTKVQMSHATQTGDRVTAQSTLTSPKFPPGVTRAIGSFTATVSNGAITQLTQTYDRSDPQTAALFKALGQ